jgi:small conductance mechanosensitive channel
MANIPLENLPSSIEKIAQNPGPLEKHIGQAVETTMAIIATYGLKTVGAIIILVVGWWVSGFVHKAIMKAGRRTQKVDLTLFMFLASLAKYAVLMFTMVATLSSFGVETTSFVAVLGATGLAIGLALQGTLGHVASGLMIVLFRPFRVGDEIEAAGVAGIVTEISLFVTEILRGDNVVIIVPNSAIWSTNIRNFTTNETRKISIEVAIAYSATIGDAVAVLHEVLSAEPRVLAEPKAAVAVTRLADNAVILLVEAWVNGKDLPDVRYDLNRRIKEAFDAKGIQGPATARQIYVAANPAAPKP